MLTGFIFLLGLSEVGKAGTIICAGVFIPAAILIPWLLLTQKIPLWLRLLTAALELASFWLMYNAVGQLHQTYLRGGFHGLT